MGLTRYLVGYRKKNKLLQKELAGALNISREHYAQIESGKIQPSIKLLKAISSQLKLDIRIDIARGKSLLLYKLKISRRP
ncbi:MAG TPA: helix-turn-helix transcriptional regulator [Bacteroidota bacterium]|jgi:transcriptional regulator with XRE-family HTH domain|nr:helix-turn-helix transcriptional regulator [Bacteroidota bacterium]